MQKRRISMPASQERYPKSRYQPCGWQWCLFAEVTLLLRARESWMEVLWDEERLELEQRTVTFAGSFWSFFCWRRRRNGTGRALDGGAAEGIGMSQFHILGCSWMSVLLTRAAMLPYTMTGRSINPVCTIDEKPTATPPLYPWAS